MRTESAPPVSLVECSDVLTKLPDLTAARFDNYYAEQHERRNTRNARNSRPPEARRPPTPITDPDLRRQIARARVFLRENSWPTKTVNRTRSSYDLKHEAERWIGRIYPREVEIPYISNGAFITAARLEGYTIKREGPNALFALRFMPEYRRLRKQRSNV